MVGAVATWLICGAATAGVIARPGGWPEAVWAVAGAVLLVVAGLLPAPAALAAAVGSLDVLLFLTGMMLLAETARVAGVFDWLAAHAARAARGRKLVLFGLVYAIGVVVTALLSNDATAVVLTPAVLAVARAARMPARPLAFACALISNAASFLLPISNPANLVMYHSRLPPLGRWLWQFLPASVAAIVVTFVVLVGWFWRDLAGRTPQAAVPCALSRRGWLGLAGLGLACVVVLGCSLAGRRLGLPAALAGGATALLVSRGRVVGVVRGISWQILPLVAGLFVLVAALESTGALAALAVPLRAVPGWVAGVAVAFGCNAMNNLPAGLLASGAAAVAQVPPETMGRLLIGIDLGPNLSVTGSLATILWLASLRREGVEVGAWQFLRVGAVAMPAALIIALLI